MKSYFPGLAAVLLLAACDAPRSATETSDPAAARATTTPAAATSFRKEITEGDHRFVLQATGTGGQQQLQMRAEEKGRELATITEPLNGTITDAVATNLNGDKFPELLVFVADAGSGSYGQLLGYEFLNQGRRTLTLPELGGTANQGYQGHDTFRVEGQQVIRTFPVYNADDPNCCPSGGQRTVQYTLREGSPMFEQTGYSTQTH